MLKISKILALFIAVGSVAFAGFVIATTFGGTDWGAELHQPYFAGYTVTRTAGENPLWQATRKIDGQQVGSDRALPRVLVKVLADARQRLNTRIQDLNAREAIITPRIALLKTTMDADKIALAKYELDLRTLLTQIGKSTSEVSAEVVAGTAESQKLENQINLRRGDILRLQQQVEELRADQSRLTQMRVELDNQLTQVQGDLLRAEERAAQFK